MARTWVVVADSSRARILQADKPLGPLEEVEMLDHPQARMHDQALTTDLPGRAFDSAGSGRHAMEQHELPKHQEAVVFARELADRLEQACRQGTCARLVIAAAPAFLGLLRKQLNGGTVKLISAEIDKNLVGLDPVKIRELLPYRL